LSSGENPDDEDPGVGESLSDIKDKFPDSDGKEPPEPLDEPEQEVPEQSADDVWNEDYEDDIDADEPPPPRPKKRRRHRGALVLAVIVLIIIIAWTAFAPEVMPEAPTAPPNPSYSNLSRFAGTIDTYAGSSTWSLFVGGPENVSAGQGFDLLVLISKTYDRPANWWFTGTSITLKNVSALDSNSSFVSAMTDKEDLGHGLLLTVPVMFASPGDYELYVFVKFIIYSDMRIGFLPTKAVEMQSGHFSIHVE